MFILVPILIFAVIVVIMMVLLSRASDRNRRRPGDDGSHRTHTDSYVGGVPFVDSSPDRSGDSDGGGGWLSGLFGGIPAATAVVAATAVAGAAATAAAAMVAAAEAATDAVCRNAKYRGSGPRFSDCSMWKLVSRCSPSPPHSGSSTGSRTRRSFGPLLVSESIRTSLPTRGIRHPKLLGRAPSRLCCCTA